MTKILAFSNIHGRFDELRSLFRKVNLDYELKEFSRIVFLGDYIGYGSQNEEVLEFLLALSKSKNVTLLKGDWEYSLEKLFSTNETLKKEALAFFTSYEAIDILKKLQTNKPLLTKWAKALQTMPYYHIEENYLFSHSGVDISKWTKEMDITHFLTNTHTPSQLVLAVDYHKMYTAYWAEKILAERIIYEPFPYHIVFGQTPIFQLLNEEKMTPQSKPFSIGEFTGIDFGAKFDEGQVGAVVFDENGMKTYVEQVGKASLISYEVKQEKDAKKKAENTPPPQTHKKSTYQKKTNTYDSSKGYEESQNNTFNLYTAGKSIEEIAKERNIKPSTVEGHLIELYKRGKQVDLSPFYQEKHEKDVVEAIKKHGFEDLKIIKQHTPKSVTYTEIKAIAAKNKLG